VTPKGSGASRAHEVENVSALPAERGVDCQHTFDEATARHGMRSIADLPQKDALAPPRLVSVLDGLLLDVAPRVLDRLGDSGARGLLTSKDRADRHLPSEKVAHPLGHLALGQAVNPHEYCDDGIDRRAECARGDACWQLAPRSMTAPTAAKRVLRILGDDGLDGGQLEHWMTMRLGVSTVKEPGTFIALLRNTGNDLVDHRRRHQHALVSLVPWLSTWLASRRRLLRSGFRTGTIAGGRLRKSSSTTSRTPLSARPAQPATPQ
jgi:hypothetical protein